jgi:hypothetical protein
MLSDYCGIEHTNYAIFIDIFSYPATWASLIPVLPDPDHVKNINGSVTIDIQLNYIAHGYGYVLGISEGAIADLEMNAGIDTTLIVCWCPGEGSSRRVKACSLR